MLTVREHMALELAATPYQYPALREEHALVELGLSPTAFWLTVDRLLDRPDALEEYAAAVARLRRLREARARARRAS